MFSKIIIIAEAQTNLPLYHYRKLQHSSRLYKPGKMSTQQGLTHQAGFKVKSLPQSDQPEVKFWIRRSRSLV